MPEYRSRPRTTPKPPKPNTSLRSQTPDQNKFRRKRNPLSEITPSQIPKDLSFDDFENTSTFDETIFHALTRNNKSTLSTNSAVISEASTDFFDYASRKENSINFSKNTSAFSANSDTTIFKRPALRKNNVSLTTKTTLDEPNDSTATDFDGARRKQHEVSTSTLDSRFSDQNDTIFNVSDRKKTFDMTENSALKSSNQENETVFHHDERCKNQLSITHEKCTETQADQTNFAPGSRESKFIDPYHDTSAPVNFKSKDDSMQMHSSQASDTCENARRETENSKFSNTLTVANKGTFSEQLYLDESGSVKGLDSSIESNMTGFSLLNDKNLQSTRIHNMTKFNQSNMSSLPENVPLEKTLSQDMSKANGSETTKFHHISRNEKSVPSQNYQEISNVSETTKFHQKTEPPSISSTDLSMQLEVTDNLSKNQSTKFAPISRRSLRNRLLRETTSTTLPENVPLDETVNQSNRSETTKFGKKSRNYESAIEQTANSSTIDNSMQLDSTKNVSMDKSTTKFIPRTRKSLRNQTLSATLPENVPLDETKVKDPETVSDTTKFHNVSRDNKSVSSQKSSKIDRKSDSTIDESMQLDETKNVSKNESSRKFRDQSTVSHKKGSLLDSVIEKTLNISIDEENLDTQTSIQPETPESSAASESTVIDTTHTLSNHSIQNESRLSQRKEASRSHCLSEQEDQSEDESSSESSIESTKFSSKNTTENSHTIVADEESVDVSMKSSDFVMNDGVEENLMQKQQSFRSESSKDVTKMMLNETTKSAKNTSAVSKVSELKSINQTEMVLDSSKSKSIMDTPVRESSLDDQTEMEINNFEGSINKSSFKTPLNSVQSTKMQISDSDFTDTSVVGHETVKSFQLEEAKTNDTCVTLHPSKVELDMSTEKF